MNAADFDDLHFIVDSKVAELYSKQLNRVLGDPKTILIDATESNKSIEAIIPIFQKLVANNARRNHEAESF
ncbi:MAG: hypothetical protein EBU33_04625 [Sphingobacteriia bacterium]|nr:hypothetical protein [Sphingobacteriia bacterium]